MRILLLYVVMFLSYPLVAQLSKHISLNEEVNIEFVRIPVGTFIMGSDSSDIFHQKDEFPAHQVTISKDFYLGKFEVTQGQWKAVMGNNPSVFHQAYNYKNYPVDMVSWDDCQAFIQKLNTLGLGTFRLPTEAEWEYACRAGTTSLYHWGADMNFGKLQRHAWYNSRAEGKSHPVGTKEPNAWGLYDMSGNVWEWCQDWRGPYKEEKQVDPSGPNEGKSKVYRGGSWFNEPEALRSSNRHGHPPDIPFTNAGLRLVLEIK